MVADSVQLQPKRNYGLAIQFKGTALGLNKTGFDDHNVCDVGFGIIYRFENTPLSLGFEGWGKAESSRSENTNVFLAPSIRFDPLRLFLKKSDLTRDTFWIGGAVFSDPDFFTKSTSGWMGVYGLRFPISGKSNMAFIMDFGMGAFFNEKFAALITFGLEGGENK